VIESAQKKIKPGIMKRLFGFGGSKKSSKKEEDKVEKASEKKKNKETNKNA
jgi:hypothetical protein